MIAKFKIKIISALVFSLVISSVLTQTIFFANTPMINKSFLAKIINFPSTVLESSRNFIASLINRSNISQNQATAIQQFKQLPVTALKSVTKGIYAQEDKANNIIYVRVTKDVEYESRVFNVNGKQVTVHFPKGSFK